MIAGNELEADMSRQLSTRALITLIALLGLGSAGCRNSMPHSATWPATGDTIPTHPKPPEGGYYTDWDPFAGTIEIDPVEAVNPVKTQHVLIATVRDKDGKPLPNRRVEWIIAEGSVGSIIEIDESGFRASRGYKLTNTFAVSHTNNFKHVITRGTEDPDDDLVLDEGQTWCVISSPVEGDTHIIAYCPAIYDWTKHKVFAVKHWYDVGWEWPPAATNMVGTPHELVTRVFKHSDGSPLVGYKVVYKLASGPGGTFAPGGSTSVSVQSDSAGLAKVTLNQDAPVEGVNDIQIDIIRPDDVQCCKPGGHIATGHTTKTWLAPQIDITKNAPPRAEVGEEFDYSIVVTNPAQMAASDVTVRDTLPNGISYVASRPAATVAGQALSWSIGDLAGGGSVPIAVKVTGQRSGTYHNCADVTASNGLSDNDCADTVIVEPKLALSMNCQVEMMLCDPLPYRVVVTNTGDGTARNVMVKVDLPDGLATGDGRGSLSFSAGNLSPGQSKEANFNLKASRQGGYALRAMASADGGLSADAGCDTRIVMPKLAVTKTGPQMRYLGRPASYQITVSNEGDAPAKDTVLVDTLPAGMEFVSASDGGHPGQGGIMWNLGTLSPGASKSVSVDMKAGRIGTISNTATARAFCTEASASYTMNVEGVPAILLEVVDVHDPIEVGANETYEITVVNQGSSEGTNIKIVATLPPEQEYVSADGPTNASVEGKTVTFAPLPRLNPKASAVYRLTVKGTAANDVRFKVMMTSDQAQEPVEETESTHIY
ncbi:MAG: DUF11 domain-containing protein [Planctomycetia bacterium]|nr:DUF11 domain-containing protein [Planctomycetia bacterium]MCC7316826.1 DUF11 domain-containing protein [Planctomycetota bacterium]OQZ01144.1 MAG: hypothetical protein B6D36_14315 [Planctomycetes bacterium UTPLA1]